MTAKSLLLRSVELAHAAAAENDEPKLDISPLAILVFALTCFVFLAMFLGCRYTYGNVIGTLTIIESAPTPGQVSLKEIDHERLPNSNAKQTDSADTDALLESDSDILVPSKPITSSLRSAMLHLRSKAGYWSRFRGLSLFVCWGIARGVLISGISFPRFMRNPPGYIAAALVAETLLARWELTWYHIVMSEPTQKPWWRRLPSLFKSRAWINIAPAVALRSATTHLTVILPMMLCRSFGTMKHLHDPTFQPGRKHLCSIFGQSLAVLFLTFALFVLLQIPATVTVVRVAASMLPEEDETIVPFDRSFGGKVKPAILGGSGRIGMLDAWRTFTRASRIRLLKLVVKVFMILVAIWAVFAMLVIAEAHLFLGDQIFDVVKALARKGHHHH